MRSLGVLLAAGVLGASSALLVGCGDRNDLIPRSDAQALQRDLDAAGTELAADPPHCKRTRLALARAQAKALELPEQVDPALRRNVSEGIRHADERVQATCRATTTTTTTATQPTETRTETTQTETTPPEPTTERTTPPPTTPPATNSGGTPSGGGNGNGGGRGAGNGRAGGDQVPE